MASLDGGLWTALCKVDASIDLLIRWEPEETDDWAHVQPGDCASLASTDEDLPPDQFRGRLWRKIRLRPPYRTAGGQTYEIVLSLGGTDMRPFR